MMKPSMHGEELPCLDICGFYLVSFGQIISRVSDDGQGIGVDGLDLVLTIQLTPQDLLTLHRYLAVGDFLVASF